MNTAGGPPQDMAPERHALFGGPTVDRVVDALSGSVLDLMAGAAGIGRATMERVWAQAERQRGGEIPPGPTRRRIADRAARNERVEIPSARIGLIRGPWWSCDG